MNLVAVVTPADSTYANEALGHSLAPISLPSTWTMG
jgi:hypothetical protein